MSDTTTEETTQSQGVEEQPQSGSDTTQPGQQQSTAAGSQEEQTQTTQEGPETQEQDAAAKADNPDDWKGWLEKKGIDPSDPQAIEKVAQNALQAERASHKKFEEASAIKKQLESQPKETVSQDPLTQKLYEEVVSLKRNTAVSDFKREHKLTSEQEGKMVEYLTTNPEKAQLVNAGYMTLSEVYRLSGVAEADPSQLKSQGGKEALQQLAAKQRTTVPQGAARTPYAQAPQEDPFMKGFDSAG